MRVRRREGGIYHVTNRRRKPSGLKQRRPGERQHRSRPIIGPGDLDSEHVAQGIARQIEEQPGAGIDTDAPGVGPDPRIPGLAGIGEDDDPDGKEVEDIAKHDGSPLSIDQGAAGAVEIVRVPAAEADICAEGELAVEFEFMRGLEKDAELKAPLTDLGGGELDSETTFSG